MKKKIDLLTIITTLICLLPMILSALVYNKLPAQIAIHFNAAGAPDNFAPRIVAAFGLPILMAALNIINHFMLNSDPKKMNASQSIRIIAKWSICIISVIIMPITLFMAMGFNIPIGIIVPAIVSILIIALGNYLPKSKQNFTVGIRLPWTLSSEENWNKTHRLAGFVWVLCGLIMLITSFFQNVPLFMILIIIIVIVPAVYSYCLYRNKIL